jgi:hypothetical protein
VVRLFLPVVRTFLPVVLLVFLVVDLTVLGLTQVALRQTPFPMVVVAQSEPSGAGIGKRQLPLPSQRGMVRQGLPEAGAHLMFPSLNVQPRLQQAPMALL